MKMQFSYSLDRIREAVSFDTNTETPPNVIMHAGAVEILSSQRRRFVIECLSDQEPERPSRYPRSPSTSQRERTPVPSENYPLKNARECT